MKWRRVSKERPPFMEMVIFYDGENVWPGWDEGNPSQGEDMSIICADPGFRNVAEEPTRWMALPQPPKV